MLVRVILVIGLVALVWGFQEQRLAQFSTAQPVPVELADLEGGTGSLTSNHVKLSPHIALFPYCVYSYEEEPGHQEATDSTPLKCVFYPVISRQHKFARQAPDVEARIRAGKLRQLPEVNGITFLVRTTEFKKLGDIPLTFPERGALTGMVVNDINSLGSEERKLLSEGIKGVDWDRVRILEPGRKPVSRTLALATMLGGVVVLIIAGLGMYSSGRAS